MRLCLLMIAIAPGLLGQGAPDIDHFETKVRPVLARNCYGCHGPDQQASGLRVDSREALLKGGKRGAAIISGRDAESLLMAALQQRGDLKMPLGGRLKDTEIDAIAEWIRKGAVWPRTAAPAVTSVKDHYTRLARGHWAFQPLKPSTGTVDALIRARLTKDGLIPAKPADKRTLLRRLSYVLTGLPPSAGEFEQFAADNTPGAYERVVDQMLNSPRFGEHWARHWMDLVRFGETRGYEWNYEVLGAWRYRDYLIRAFNRDVPYDQLIREHIAGDLLAKPRIDGKEQVNESIIGTAFYRLGEAGHDDCIQFREIALDVVDNQIDTLTKTFQGLTVSCARCHDHKLDPIPTTDYYGLYGVLNSSHHVTQTIDAPEANAEPIARLRLLKRQIREELASLWRLDTWSIGKLDDPANLYSRLGKEPWAEIVAAFQKDAAARAAFNRTNFDPLPLQGWHASGMGLRNGLAKAGEFSVAAEGDAAVAGIYPEGFYTHLDSSRLNGALRLPELPTKRKFVSVLAMGAMLGSHRVVIDNCAIGEGNKVLENDTLAWQKAAVPKAGPLPVYLELITRFDNPRIPDRPGVLKAQQMKWMESPRSYFGIAQAVAHDIDATPKDDISWLRPLFDGPAPVDQQQLEARYRTIAGKAIERWAHGEPTADDVRWLDWLLRKQVLTNTRNATPRLAQLIGEYRKVESEIAPPRVIEGLADIGNGRDFPVLTSGSPQNPGAAAPRTFLRYLFGEGPLTNKGSGRLELAEKLASKNNPLTARVMVNRIWHYVFGRGLVASVDNFGLLGDRPSHPELLDGLSARFIAGGWSVKKMIRLLVTSETFRQSGAASAQSREIDPQNTLLQHYPLRRLSAEELRDSILSASGRLRDEMYGGSVHPHREKPQDYRRLFSGPLDGEGRRSLYVKVTRMESARFLETFDYPNPMATRGARDVTNVPAQALTLLNDPFVIAESARLAERVKQAGTQFDDRLTALFRFTLGRVPDATERERFRGLSAELASLGGEPWAHLAHAALNLKEFLYIQ
jgi:hypothetical protein